MALLGKPAPRVRHVPLTKIEQTIKANLERDPHFYDDPSAPPMVVLQHTSESFEGAKRAMVYRPQVEDFPAYMGVHAKQHFLENQAQRAHEAWRREVEEDRPEEDQPSWEHASMGTTRMRS